MFLAILKVFPVHDRGTESMAELHKVAEFSNAFEWIARGPHAALERG